MIEAFPCPTSDAMIAKVSVISSAVVALASVVLGLFLTWRFQRKQQKWELKRDAVRKALRVSVLFQDAIVELNGLLRESQNGRADEELERKLRDASDRVIELPSAYKCAQIDVDLVVGGQFAKDLSAYLSSSHELANRLLEKRQVVFESKEDKREHAKKLGDLIISAREALGIKDAGELPAHYPR